MVRSAVLAGPTRMLESREIQLALLWDYDWRRVDDPTLHLTELLDDTTALIVSAGHPLARRTPVNLSELAREDWITRADSHPVAEVLARSCRAAGFEPRIAFHAHDYQEAQAVVAVVAIGLGVALAPRLALTNLRSRVCVIPLALSAHPAHPPRPPPRTPRHARHGRGGEGVPGGGRGARRPGARPALTHRPRGPVDMPWGLRRNPSRAPLFPVAPVSLWPVSAHGLGACPADPGADEIRERLAGGPAGGRPPAFGRASYQRGNEVERTINGLGELPCRHHEFDGRACPLHGTATRRSDPPLARPRSAGISPHRGHDSRRDPQTEPHTRPVEFHPSPARGRHGQDTRTRFLRLPGNPPKTARRGCEDRHRNTSPDRQGIRTKRPASVSDVVRRTAEGTDRASPARRVVRCGRIVRSHELNSRSGHGREAGYFGQAGGPAIRR